MGISQVIVLDTHIWIWWISNPEQLTENAKNAIEKGVAERTICVSSICAWEVAMLVSKGRLQLTMDVNDWISKSETLPFLHFEPVNNRIAMKAVGLPGYIHNDPVDRIIIATALVLGAVLVTKDEKIRSYSHVKTVW